MKPEQEIIVSQPEPEPRSVLLWIVRYGIGIVMCLAGGIALLVSPSSNGPDGLAMGLGGGLSVLLLNYLFRLGVSGDKEREQHEEAWHYFEEHGVWPDEEPTGRVWAVAAGTVMYEDEARATHTV